MNGEQAVFASTKCGGIHTPRNIVLIETLKQLCQFSLAFVYGVDFLLKRCDLPLCLFALFLSDVFPKEQLILTSEMGDAADIVQKDSTKLAFPNVVAGADIPALLLVGGAYKKFFITSIVCDRCNTIASMSKAFSLSVAGNAGSV